MVAEAFLISVAANLAHDLFKTCASYLRDRGFGTEEQNALKRAYGSAFEEMFRASSGRLDRTSLALQADLLSAFVSDEMVSRLLIGLSLQGGPLPDSVLREQFLVLGGKIEWFPGDFEQAMGAFVRGLASGLRKEAAQPSSPLFPLVALARLDETLQQLTRIEALVLPRVEPSETGSIPDGALCPYMGLAAFNEHDAAFFHGRGRAVDQLIEILRPVPRLRFLAVLGPSGSGKSSLVQAGLIPRLRGGARHGGIPNSNHWQVITTRPADELAVAALAGTIEDQSVEFFCEIRNVMPEPDEETQIILIIDQFEELFVGYPDSLREVFISQLASIVDGSDGRHPLTVVVVMRDDFYSRFIEQASPLVTWLEQGRVFNVPHILDQGDLEEIIQAPANEVGVEFDQGLIELIASDAIGASPFRWGGEARAHVTILPLLESALTELWGQIRGHRLTLEGYQSIGGVTGALTQWAHAAYRGLPINQQPLARRILTDLVHLGADTHEPDSRWRRYQPELYWNLGEATAVGDVIHVLSGKRLLVTAREHNSGQTTIELIHDVLLREWFDLRQWLEKSVL